MKLVAGVIFLWWRGEWKEWRVMESFVNARKRNAVE